MDSGEGSRPKISLKASWKPEVGRGGAASLDRETMSLKAWKVDDDLRNHLIL